MKPYDFKSVEKKWQDKWEETGVFHAVDFSEKPKFYGLVEFPYPSGAGMHVGHIKAYSGLEVIQQITALPLAEEPNEQGYTPPLDEIKILSVKISSYSQEDKELNELPVSWLSPVTVLFHKYFIHADVNIIKIPKYLQEIRIFTLQIFRNVV